MEGNDKEESGEKMKFNPNDPKYWKDFNPFEKATDFVDGKSEACIAIARANREKNKTQDMREKVSQGNKGKIRTKEALKNLSDSITKVSSTDEWKYNHTIGLMKRAKNESWKKNVGGWNKGKPHDEKTLKKMRKPRSEEGKMNMRGPRKKKTCPHCGFIGGGPNMSRYHFDNCKHKP